MSHVEEQERELPHIWQLTQRRYQYLRLAGQPHRPAQATEHTGEAPASAMCQVEYQRLVCDAYRREEFTLESAGLSADAKSAVRRLIHEPQRQEQGARLIAAHLENRITSVDDAQIGDQIFTLYGGRYVNIKGKDQTSFQCQDASGAPFIIKAGAAQWLRSDDLIKAVAAGHPINPHRVPAPDPEPPRPAGAAQRQDEPRPSTVVAPRRTPLTTVAPSPVVTSHERAAEIIVEEMERHGLRERGWTFRFDQSRSRFGLCHEAHQYLSFSWPMIKINTEAELRETVRHEMAHAKAGVSAKHGRRWKLMALAVGGRPEARCGAHVNTPDDKYHAACDGCGIIHKLSRLPKKTDYCAVCVRQHIHPSMSRERRAAVYEKAKLIWVEQATGQRAVNQDERRRAGATPAVATPPGNEPEGWTVKPITHATQPSLFQE